MRYAATLALGAVLLALCGCGASGKAAPPPPEYSVQQVEAAFRAQGLLLRQARFGPASGVVRLSYPGIEVDVVANDASWISVISGGERRSELRNLTVEWEPRLDKPVRLALRRLRAHV
ncbi:MAG TPA: hypothetical protein VKB43_11040 [Gaiellaceae bacterium]|nr:hypothetical protein [Gaiellaceae bacterium]